jgi:hypothetical protein
MAAVWSLEADSAARGGTAIAKLVGESEAAVMTTMLTAVEAWPAELEVIEVKVWVDDSSEFVALVVSVAVAPPERISACVSYFTSTGKWVVSYHRESTRTELVLRIRRRKMGLQRRDA